MLIILDSLRKDKVTKELMPNLYELKEKGTFFNRTITVMNATVPSVTSLFTGCFPSTHGITKNGLKFPDNLPTLSEKMKEQGYTTMASIGVECIGSAYNYDRGFDYFYDNSKYNKLMYYVSKVKIGRYKLSMIPWYFGWFDTYSRISEKVNKDVFAWLDKHHQEKFFMLVNYFDIHRDAFGNKTKRVEKSKNYDENVRIMDRNLKKLFNRMKELNIYDNTLFVILSDHGETLEGEGRVGHGWELCEREFNVPLIMFNKDLMPVKQVNHLTRTIDIMPTVLDLLGIPYGEMDGLSLRETIFEDKELVKEVKVSTYTDFTNTKGIFTKEGFHKEGE